VLDTDRPLVRVDVDAPSLTFYLDRAAEHVHVRALPARLARGDRPLILVSDPDRAALERMGLPLRRLHQVGRWWVYEPA
jgi:hypothetical protein